MPDSNLADNSVLTSSFYNTYIREQVIVTCTSGTRPSHAEGRVIYETDTDKFMCSTGSGWRLFGGLAWNTFTPSWTNLTVGSGATQTWAYHYGPGFMLVTGTTELGTSPSVGGIVSMTIPNSETAAYISVGTAVYVDTATPYSGSCQASSTSISFFAGTSGYFTTGAPFTVAAGDDIRATIKIPLT